MTNSWCKRSTGQDDKADDLVLVDVGKEKVENVNLFGDCWRHQCTR